MDGDLLYTDYITLHYKRSTTLGDLHYLQVLFLLKTNKAECIEPTGVYVSLCMFTSLFEDMK